MSTSNLAEIVDDGSTDLQSFIQMDDFLRFINQEPPAALIKKHPLASGVRYIPIDKVELLLSKVFQYWYVEILNSGQLLNAVSVTVRLYYMHPILKEWQHQDGIGAVAIQVDQGKNASDLGAIKSNAIMLGLPAAKSYATKDAAENIGKIFGRDLNRKDTMAFTPSYGTEDVKADQQARAKEKIEAAKSKAADMKGMTDENS